MTPVALLALLTMAVAAPALGQAGGSFIGAWTIAKAERAPWASAGAGMRPGQDGKALVGKAVIIEEARVTGPAPLACRNPDYEVKDYTPDMLFEGALTEPEKQAATLGFGQEPVPTLITGCPARIEFHLKPAGTLLFRLDSVVYTLVRR